MITICILFFFIFLMISFKGVYHCGYHSEKAYGATSYHIVHPKGNILVDRWCSRIFFPWLFQFCGVACMTTCKHNDQAFSFVQSSLSCEINKENWKTWRCILLVSNPHVWKIEKSNFLLQCYYDHATCFPSHPSLQCKFLHLVTLVSIKIFFSTFERKVIAWGRLIVELIF